MSMKLARQLGDTASVEVNDESSETRQDKQARQPPYVQHSQISSQETSVRVDAFVQCIHEPSRS